MYEEKCINYIIEKLEIDKSLGNKVYEKFWDFIFEKIANDGVAEIQGIGTFSIEEREVNKKKQNYLDFKVSQSLLSRLDIK
jgi:nucleoid DNA-binding protein